MKNKIPLFALCVFLLWLLVFSIAKIALPDYREVSVFKEEPLVFVTTYGEKYHSENCHYLKSAVRSMGKEEAINQGYTACSYCKGRAYETVIVEYKEEQAIDDYEDSILIASVTSLCLFLFFMPFILAITRKASK